MTDAIFRALANPLRRGLLDRLRARDGQTLGELCDDQAVGRVGVMQHLRVLRGAGLITVRHIGRQTFHYLNPVPIQEIQDRWISRYAASFTEAMSELKKAMEQESGGDASATAAKPRHVFVIYIRTTAEALWQAITDPDITQRYYYGMRVDTTLEIGSPLRFRAGGKLVHDGEILSVEPGRRLVHSFCFADSDDGLSRVTWEIEEQDDLCRLTLTHDDFDGETETYKAVRLGWYPIFAGLKTLLETGEPLTIPDSLRPRELADE